MDLAAELEKTPGGSVPSSTGTTIRRRPLPSRAGCAVRSATRRLCSMSRSISFIPTPPAYADIVLPAASFLECDDLVLSYFDLTLSAQAKAGDPPGVALSNAEIFRRLAAAMGYDDPALFESDAGASRPIAGPDAVSRHVRGSGGEGNGDAVSRNRASSSKAWSSPRPPDGSNWPASGQSSTGLPRLPEPHADARPAKGHLRILSPASLWLMNSSYGNDATIRKRLGAPTVTLHPDDAACEGLAEGDAVVLSNERWQSAARRHDFRCGAARCRHRSQGPLAGGVTRQCQCERAGVASKERHCRKHHRARHRSSAPARGGRRSERDLIRCRDHGRRPGRHLRRLRARAGRPVERGGRRAPRGRRPVRRALSRKADLRHSQPPGCKRRRPDRRFAAAERALRAPPIS